MKTILALMLAGAFLTSPMIARAGDEAPAADAKPAKKSKKKDAAPKADAPAPAPDKKAEKGGW
jgi:hypothetical protein